MNVVSALGISIAIGIEILIHRHNMKLIHQKHEPFLKYIDKLYDKLERKQSLK